MKTYAMIAKDDLKYPEYPVPNWLEGEVYTGTEMDGDILCVESETGPFFFSGNARERLPEIFVMHLFKEVSA